MSKFISDGAKFMCPFCSTTPELKVSSSSTSSSEKRLANESNCSFPPPGGVCNVSPSSPKPCTPDVSLCSSGQSAVKVDGSNALNMGCSFSCSSGGVLTPCDPGQVATEEC